MHRSLKWALVMAAAAGIAGVPGVASATVSGGNAGTVIVGDDNQVAGYDIINAGCDANLGSHNRSHEDSKHENKCDRHEHSHEHSHEGSNGQENGTENGSGMGDEQQTAGGNAGTVIVGDRNQVAGDDIVNAGENANLGSFNSTGMGPEMGSLLNDATHSMNL
jgi:hypothetical protein